MPRIYAAYIATALMLYVSGVDVEAFGAIGTLSKLLSASAILLSGLYFLFQNGTWRYGRLNKIVSVFYLLFILYGLTSFYWTFSAQATVTALAAWLYTAALCIILSGLKDEDCYRIFLDVIFAFCVAGYIQLIFGSDAFVVNQGVERYQGVFFGPHALAAPTSLAMIIIISGVVPQTPKVRLIYFAATGLSLYMTYSRQAFMAATVGIFLTLFFKSTQTTRSRTTVILILSAIALGLLIELTGGFSEDFIARGEGDDVTTLTGRTLIWNAATDLISEKPFLGYGIGAGGVVLEDYYAAGVAGWRTFNAHNGFLQAQLDLGLVGMTAFMILFAYFIRSAFFSKNYLRIGLASSVLVITMVGRGAYGLGGMAATLFLFFAFRYSGKSKN